MSYIELLIGVALLGIAVYMIISKQISVTGAFEKESHLLDWGVEYEYQGKLYKFDDLPASEQERIRKLQEFESKGKVR